MLAALATSALFLVSYLAYHFQVGSVRFTGQGLVRSVYFAVLISHTILAAAIVPLVLVTRGPRTGGPIRGPQRHRPLDAPAVALRVRDRRRRLLDAVPDELEAEGLQPTGGSGGPQPPQLGTQAFESREGRPGKSTAEGAQGTRAQEPAGRLKGGLDSPPYPPVGINRLWRASGSGFCFSAGFGAGAAWRASAVLLWLLPPPRARLGAANVVRQVGTSSRDPPAGSPWGALRPVRRPRAQSARPLPWRAASSEPPRAPGGERPRPQDTLLVPARAKGNPCAESVGYRCPVRRSASSTTSSAFAGRS